MAQFAADGAVVGEGPGVHARTRREDSAAIASGVGSLLGVGSDRRIVRGIPVPWVCHGGIDARRVARLGRGAIVLCSFWVGTPLPGERWAGEHTGHWHSVRDSANRVRWGSSRNVMAYCSGCSGGSGGAEVPS